MNLKSWESTERAQASDVLWCHVVLFLTLFLLLALPVAAQSLLFDANAGESAVGPGNQPDISGEITVEAWVRIAAGADSEGLNFIVSKNINGTGYALLAAGTASSKRFRFETNTSAGGTIEGTSRPQPGVWTHVAGVWGSGRSRLYVNGMLEAEATVTAPPVTNSEPVRIGSSQFGTHLNWRGEIDEVRIWTRALTSTEIRRSMWSSIDIGEVGRDYDLVASWTLDEGAGSMAADRSGNGLNLNLSATAWSANVALAVPGLSAVITGVNQIVSTGTPGSVLGFAGNWQALAGGDADASLLSTFSMASRFGQGRVAILGHDGLPANVALLDNRKYMLQLIAWLTAGRGNSVAYTTGHSEFLNASIDGLRSALTSSGSTLTPIGPVITAAGLSPHHTLIIGNAWGVLTTAEINAIDNWTAAGGGVLLVGLGWSWPGAFADYPMVRVGERFGVTWLRNYIGDPSNNFNDSPIFSRFFPAALQSSLPTSAKSLRSAFETHPVNLPDALALDGELQLSFGRAHAILAQAPLVLTQGSPRLADVAQLHLDILSGSGSTLLAKSRRYALQHQAFAWLRERFYKTLIESTPLTVQGSGSQFEAITLDGDFPEFYRRQLLDHGIYIMDNSASTADQQRVLAALFDLVPTNLHDLAFLSMRDSIGSTLPAGMTDSEYFAGNRSSVNTFSTPVGAVIENSFPGDVPGLPADQFTMAAAHELNHIVDAFHVTRSPTLAARRNALIAQAGATPLNYLRSMFSSDFFVNNPQEFIASIANQWFSDSARVFDLGAARFQGNRPSPMNQALLFAEIYAQGGRVAMYRSDANGGLTRTDVPFARDAAGHINRLEIPGTTWTFVRQPVSGDVLAYQRISQTTSTLQVSKGGSGVGTVTSSPTGIDCGLTCTASFTTNAAVSLTAIAAPNSTFAGWSGDCSGTQPTCALSMSQARNVSAAFNTSTHTLSVIRDGTGSGVVTSNPSGINCGSICSNAYNAGTNVTLTATANAGSTFAGWSGSGCAGTSACTVTMNQARNLTAIFTLPSPSTFSLTVAREGTGSGTVTSNPAGINCGSACVNNFSANAQITLSAMPSPGAIFTGWSGDCSGTQSQCTLILTQSRHVRARFAVAVPGIAEPRAIVNLPLTTGVACAAFYSVKTYGDPGIVPGVTATEITLQGNDRRIVGGLIMKGNVLRTGAFAGVTVPATPGRAVQLAPVVFWLPPDLGAASLQVVTGNQTLANVRLPARSGAQVIPPVLIGDGGGYFSIRLIPDSQAEFGDRPFAIELGVKFADNTSAFFDSGTVVGGVIDSTHPTEVSFCMAQAQPVQIRTLGFPTYADGVTGQYFTIRNPQELVVFDSRDHVNPPPGPLSLALLDAPPAAYHSARLSILPQVAPSEGYLDIDVSGAGTFLPENTLRGPILTNLTGPLLVAPPTFLFQTQPTLTYHVRVTHLSGQVSNALRIEQSRPILATATPGVPSTTLDLMLKAVLSELGEPALSGEAGRLRAGQTHDALVQLGRASSRLDLHAMALLQAMFSSAASNGQGLDRNSARGLLENVWDSTFDCLEDLMSSGASGTSAGDACFDTAVSAVRDTFIPGINELQGRLASVTSRLSSLLRLRGPAANYIERLAFNAEVTSHAAEVARFSLSLPGIQNDPDALTDYVGERLTEYGRSRLYEQLLGDIGEYADNVGGLFDAADASGVLAQLSTLQISMLRSLEEDSMDTLSTTDQLLADPESWGGQGPGAELPDFIPDTQGQSPAEVCSDPQLRDALASLFSSCEQAVSAFSDPEFQREIQPLFLVPLQSLLSELTACLEMEDADCSELSDQVNALLQGLVRSVNAFRAEGCDGGYATFDIGNSLTCVWQTLVASTGSSTCAIPGTRVTPYQTGGTPVCIYFSRDYLRNNTCLPNYSRVFWEPLQADTCRWTSLPLGLPAAYSVIKSSRSRSVLER